MGSNRLESDDNQRLQGLRISPRVSAPRHCAILLTQARPNRQWVLPRRYRWVGASPSRTASATSSRAFRTCSRVTAPATCRCT